MELLSGLEAELSPMSYAVLMQTAADRRAEAALYRRWWGESRVDGVLLYDVRHADERVATVREVGLPAVVVGPASGSCGLPSVWSDDRASTVEVIEHLATLGHRRIASVGGGTRTAAFVAACGRLGLAEPWTVRTDDSGAGAAQATRELLDRASRPTALLYGSGAMAVAGLAVAARTGLSVPDDLSVVVWEDSPVCRLADPPLTALSRDVAACGRYAARLLLAAIADTPAAGAHDVPARLMLRGSTSRAAAMVTRAAPRQGWRPAAR